MAKTPNVKKKATANPRSRASKRATSPSIDVDKSLKAAPRASNATPVLSAHVDGGIMKPKRKRQRQRLRGQRLRHEKGLERAEIVQDQLKKKVGDASTQLKKMRERRGMWDEVNVTNKFDKLNTVLGDNMDEMVEGEWVDEAMEEEAKENHDMKVVDGVKLPASAALTKLVVVDRIASAPTTDAEDETDKIT